MNDAERRYTRGLVEVRGDGLSAVGGYAAKFNKLSQNLGGFVERLAPTFFAKSAADGWPDVLARYNHDDNMLLGTSTSGTLTLRVDDTGLDYTVNPPKHRGDVVELIQRGDVRQSSFAFRLPEGGGDDWGMTEQGFPLRTLVSGKLIDVAPVNSPAYLDTTTGLRSFAAHFDADPAEVEAAAKAGELRRFFAGPPPKVIDLAGRAATPPADDDVTTPDGVEPSATDPGRSHGQGDTHPGIAVRRRRTDLLMRRLSPLEQGATHSAPSDTSNETE